MTPQRIVPELTPENEYFWTSGAHGTLSILRCGDCATYLHPPAPVCPRCLSRSLSPEPVSGLATVETFTVNHQPWNPGVPVPYVVAVVVLDEQDDLRLMTNIAGAATEDVAIGMRVRVVFERHGDVWIPLFAPVTA